MITTPEQMREAAAHDNDLIRRGDVTAIPLLGMTVTQIERAIRAIPIAPQPATDWTACAADMLRVWDTWFGGSADGDGAAARKLSIASAFAAQAFEHAASSGITADGAPAALLRAFLLAMIDKLHPDLDYLRADPASGEKARADRGAVAPPVAATPQPMAVTVKPLVDRFDVALELDGTTISAFMEECEDGYWVRISDYEALSALTIQPADPLSDPRVKALVEAAKRALNNLENTESEFGITLESADSVRAALRAIGGEA